METYLFCVGIVLAGSVWMRFLAAGETITPGEPPERETRRRT